MNSARLKTSPRLQRLLLHLQNRGKYGTTTAQAAQATGVMSVSTAISEIRSQGYPIRCQFEGVTQQGSKIFRYFLEGA